MRYFKKSRKFSLAMLLLVIIAGIGAYFLFNGIKKASAEWFDQNWYYRQAVNITNAGTAQTDYQVYTTLDTATLITAGKLQSNCNDIRVTDNNGKVIPYWIETGTAACNTSATVIWTKVPSIPTTGQTIYVYYGNPNAVNAQNGNNVFLFFSDFSSISDWTSSSYTGGAIIAVGGEAKIREYQHYHANIRKQFSGSLQNTIIEGLIRYDNTETAIGESWYPRLSAYVSSSVEVAAGAVQYSTGTLPTNKLRYTANGGGTDVAATNYAAGDRAVIKLAFSTNQYAVAARLQSSGSWDGATTNSYTVSSLDNAYIVLGKRPANDDYSSPGSIGTHYWDWVRVRKYAATEPTIGSTGSEEKSPAPIAYWKFDEGQGVTANDSSSNQNTGSLGAGTAAYMPTWQAGDLCVSGKCLYFDGTNDYIDAGTGANLNSAFGAESFTFSVWIKTKFKADYQGIINKRSSPYYSASPGGLFIDSDGNTIRFLIGTGNDNESYNSITSTVDHGTWTYWTATAGSGVMRLYKNGVQVGSDLNITKDPPTNTDHLTIGSFYGTTRTFSGLMDDVKIYPYARTAAQIKADYVSRGSASGSSAQIGGQSAGISNGLVGYWKMDEASWNGTAGEVVDSSGTGNNGTGGGSVTTGVGKFGNGGVFNGSSQYVNISDSSSLRLTGDTTYSAWVNFSSLANNDIIDKGCGGYSFWYYPSNGKLLFGQQCTAGALWAGAAITSGAWHHIVGTYKSGILSLYIDGQLQNAFAYTTTITSTATLQIGHGGDGYFPGSVDEVRIYNRALSAKEVSDLYNFAPGPVGWWKMDDKVSGNSQTLVDSSTYGNNATTNYGANTTGMNCKIIGKYGGGCALDGVDDYIVFSSISNPAQTQEGWFYFSQGATAKGNFNYLFDNLYQHNANNYIYITATNDYFNFVPALNTWYHIAFVYSSSSDDSTAKLYVNGVAYSLTQQSGTHTVGSVSTISAAIANKAFKGSVDDVRIYNYARTAKQIAEDMNAGHPSIGSPVGSYAAWWKFDEGHDNTIYDQSGNTNTGTNHGASWTNDGKFGKALSFNGINNYVDVGNGASLNMTGDQTTSAWIYTKSYQDSRIVVKDSAWHGIYSTAGGNIRSYFFAAGDSYAVATNPPPLGQWVNVATVFDFTTKHIKIYYNGVLQSLSTDTAGSGARIVNSNNASIGAFTNASLPFNGIIDEVKIYPFALTQADIQAEYNRRSTLAMGTFSDTSGLTGGSIASNSASALYCIPGDTSTCNAPVGEWKFDENVKGDVKTVYDTSGNGNKGTTYNGANASGMNCTVLGKYATGCKFDGVDDYVDAGSNPQLNLTDNITLEAWINIGNVAGTNPIIAKVTGVTTTSTVFWMDERSSNQLYFGGYTPGGAAAYVNFTYAFQNNTWYHVAGVDNGSNLILYVNGAQIGSGARATRYSDVTAPVQIGTRGGIFFGGIIDDVKIYNYARTPAQIAWDYNRGKPVGWWKFDECQGVTAVDSSGNGYTGTITIGTGAGTGHQDSVGTCTVNAATAWYNGAVGKYNSSLNFDGIDDYVATAAIPISSTMTWSIWYKTGTSKAEFLIDQRSSNVGVQPIYAYADGRIQFYDSGVGTSLETAMGVFKFDGNWHNVVAVGTASTRKIYYDGVLVGSLGTGITSQTARAAYFGIRHSLDGVTQFNGQLDDAKIYNYALTPAQILLDYNQGAAVRFGPTSGRP